MEGVPGLDARLREVDALREQRQLLREALEANRISLSRAVRATSGSMNADKHYTICVDFDGVLHRYDSPWSSAEEIPDPPVDGAMEWLREMTRHFHVVVHTTRARHEDGASAVWEWLFEHAGADVARAVTISSEKYPALLYVDDRAWRFEGPGTFPTRDDVHRALPWHKREGARP